MIFQKEISLAFENLDAISNQGSPKPSLKQQRDGETLTNECETEAVANKTADFKKQIVEGPSLLKLEKHVIILMNH